MKVVCYAYMQHQFEFMAKFAAGLRRFGIQAQIRSIKEPMEADLVVLWGHRQKKLFDQQRKRGLHYLVMERGYIGDRFTWTSLGFDGLNGRATFPSIDDGMARWKRFFAGSLKPWRHSKFSNLAVIMGQCRGDASLIGVDFPLWCDTIAKRLISAKFMPIFRPHPGDSSMTVPGVKNLDGSLQTALDSAALVVTFNSNSGVDAVMNGTPLFADDIGSMAWDLSCKELDSETPDRTEWAKKMAYTQWLPGEIEAGEAWAALRTVI